MAKFPSRFTPSVPYSGTPTDVPVRGAGRMADPSSPEEWQDALGQYQDEHNPIETVDPDEDPDVWDSIQENGIDMMLGVPRGIVQAGMGLYDLADWATLDLLPDWEKNPLGRSKTALGGLIEGMTNFATGFIPIVGWLGKAGQAHKAFRGFGLLYKTKGAFGKLAGKAGRMPHGGKVVRTVFGERYISKAAERALRVKGLNNKHFRRMANLSRGGRYLTAGILTDFTVFDAHEQRMSDMMNTAFGGALANPVSEYLASDPDDSELEGRLKNVMEGLLFEAGIGSAVGLTRAVIGGIRAIKNGRRIRAAGGSPQEVDSAMINTKNGPVDDAAEIGEQAQEVLEDSHTRPPDPETDAPESRVFSARRRGQAPDVQGGRVETPRPGTEAPTPDTDINAGSTRNIIQEGMDLDKQWKGLGTKGKGLRERRSLLLSPYIEKLMVYANKVLDQLELVEGVDVKTIRVSKFNELRDMPNSKKKADMIRDFLNKTVLPLQEGNLELRTVAPGKPIDAPTRERRAIREDELIRVGKEANSNNEYQTTLWNRLTHLSKQPGKRVDIPDRTSASWKKMSQAQRARELRKRVLDAEFGHLAHGKETITMTKGLRKGIRNLTTAASNAKNLFDEYGKLRVNEVRELFESMHENERAFFKGILGLPEGRSQVRRQPVGPEGVAGTGEFSIGLEGRNQRDILATAIEWAKDPMFKPKVQKGRKTTTQDYYDLVDEIFGHNIDPADVGQVQKALGMGEELSEAAGKAERLTHAFKILQQGYYLEVANISEAYRKAVAAGNRDESNKLGMSMVASFFNLNNMAEQWMRAGSLTGAALEARKTIDITQYLKSHDLIDKGLDDQIEHLNLLVSSGDVPEEIITQYKRSMSLRGKLINAGVEAWTNALISGPKTIFGVTTVGNVFGMFYFPLERLVGHSVIGAGYSVLGKSELAKANFKEVETVAKMMTNMVLQANYTLRGTSRVMRTGKSRVIPGSSMMDSPATGHRADTQQITAENFWSPEAGVRNQLGRWVKGESGEWQFESSDKGAIIDWLGGFLNLPSRTMKSMDEIYKTAVVRSYVESELAAQGLKFIVHGKQGGNRWGQGRETITMETKQQGYEKRKAQDIEIENIWESGTNAKFADQAVLAEEITAQVNGKIYKLIDENGSVYTKARVHEDALQRVIGEGEHTAGSLGFKHEVKRIVDEEWNPQVGAIGMEAQRLGLKSTWQDPLERGGLSTAISKYAKSHPLARLLFPFIKTPTNLLRFVTQRAPRAKFVSEFRQLQKQANQFKAEGAEQLYREAQKKSAEILGRLSMGVTLFTSASYLAFSGTVTGNGPRNKNARRNLEASGWQPYSFRIGDSYYSYSRLEPLSTFLGLAADLVEISNHTYEHDYGDTVLETIASSLAGSLSNNITNKTYLTGLTNFLNAAQDGERFGWKLLQSYLTSAMPYSSFMYQTRGTYQKVVNDEDMKFRDARDIFDAYAKKTGWNLEDVPLRYDLTGKPVNRPNGNWPSLGLDLTFDWVNPFTVSRSSKDPVAQAFVDLKLNDGPPKAMIRGHIDMRDEYNEGSKESAYSAYQRVTGEVKIGGRTLHQALDRLVRHKAWKKIPKDPIEGVDSPARNLIRSIVQKYRRTAFKTVLRDYPTLLAKYQNAQRTKAQFLR